MKIKDPFPEQVKLSVARRDNLVSIENHDGVVVITAIGDNFSPSQKSLFVRYLAAEGFIPNVYQEFTDADLECSSRLKWIDDRATLHVKPSRNKELWQILRLIGCVALLWLALIIFAFLHAPH